MNNTFARLSNDRTRKGVLFFIIIIFFLLIYFFNTIYPIIGEDWDYSFLWASDGSNSERISKVSDIFVSQYNHYFTWGGESVVHVIDQLLLYMGSTWHDLINTLAYILFVYLVYKIVDYQRKVSVSVFLLVALGLWFFLPNFPTLILQITYSAVYLWGTLIVLAFIYPYYRYYRTPTMRDSLPMSVLMFFAGILAGWTYENMALILIAFLILMFFVMRHLQIKIPKWMVIGFIGVLVGYALLLLAPGNFKRVTSASDVGFIYTAMYRVWDLLKLYVQYILPLSIPYFIIYYFFVNKATMDGKMKIQLISIVFFIAAHIGLLVMLASPILQAQTLFGIVVFMIIAIDILFVNTPLSPLVYRAIWVTIGAMFILFCFDYYDKYRYISYLDDFWHKRELFIEEQKKQGIEDIVFTDSVVLDENFIMCDFKEFSEGWPNSSYAKYYDVRSVVKE